MTIARIVAGRDQQIVHCSAKETVREAAQMLADRRIGALPVLDRGMVAGIFSERDLLYCVAKHGDGALGLTVGDVMTAPAITVDSATTVHDALELMTRRRIRHLPVVEGGRLVDLSVVDVDGREEHLRRVGAGKIIGRFPLGPELRAFRPGVERLRLVASRLVVGTRL